MKKFITNPKGNILITALFAIAMVSGGFFMMAGYMNQIYKSEQQKFLQYRIGILQQSLMGVIRHDPSWTETVNNAVNASAGFPCLVTGGCGPISADFSLFDAAGTRLSDPSDPKVGLDLNGVPCHNFDVSSPDASCPLRFEFQWVVDCTSCVIKVPRVTAKVLFSYPENVPIQVENFKIDFARGKEAGSVGETCHSMKGKLNPVTGKCTLPFAGVPCGTASSMDGTLSNGEINCKKSPAYGIQDCPPNMKTVGVDEEGQITCAVI